MTGTLTLDRKADPETPWHWTDRSGSLEMSDRIVLALHRLPEQPDRLCARDLHLGGLIDGTFKITARGADVRDHYRREMSQ